MSVKVNVIQRSMFPRIIDPEDIILDGMSFGCLKDGVFEDGAGDGQEAVAYHQNHIGRGIHITCDNEKRQYELTLNLPSSSEELDDFFQMTARLAKLAICEVLLNDAPFIPKKFKETKAKFQAYNLKLLHEIMSVILNEPPHTMVIGCVFHRLVAGTKEADRMWAGVNTDAYRDWMHESQRRGNFFSEARIEASEDGNEHIALFRLPMEQTVIFPDHMELPVKFYDLSTGHPKCDISRWLVEIVEGESRKVIGTMNLEAFRRVLPKEKVSYFDAGSSLIAPLSREEVNLMMKEADNS